MWSLELSMRYQNCMKLDFIIDKRLRVATVAATPPPLICPALRKTMFARLKLLFACSLSCNAIIMLLCIQLCIPGARIGWLFTHKSDAPASWRVQKIACWNWQRCWCIMHAMIPLLQFSRLSFPAWTVFSTCEWIFCVFLLIWHGEKFDEMRSCD